MLSSLIPGSTGQQPYLAYRDLTMTSARRPRAHWPGAKSAGHPGHRQPDDRDPRRRRRVRGWTEV